MAVPFELHRPPAELAIPVIVEIPHAGVFAPESTLALLRVPARTLAEDADLYVDRLYAGVTELGAYSLVCKMSRYVVDMNRSELDVDGLTVAGKVSAHASIRGVVWRQSGRGEPVLSRPLREDEFYDRLDRYHRPYHRALRELIAEVRARFGYVIVLAAHSMPSRTDRLGEVADVVPGSRGGTSAAPAVLSCVERVAREHNLGLRHDVPYRGGYTTVHYGKPSDGVHVIQIELARRLYMDEKTLSLSPRAPSTQRFCAALVRALGELEGRALGA